MATERQSPDAILVATEQSGAVTVIDEDPDSSGTDFLTASGNNVNTDCRVSFPTPSGNPTVGADLQEFRIQVREFDTGQTGTPDARIELWENGSLVRAGSDVGVTSQDQVISFTWNANELGTADGSLVECKFVGTKSGGSPGARNTTELGAVEWNVDYTAAAPKTVTTSLGAMIQEQDKTVATSLGGMVQVLDQTLTTSLGGMVQAQDLTQTTDLGALIEQLDVLQTSALDGMLQVPDQEVATSLGAIVVLTSTLTADLNAIVKAFGVTQTADLGALLEIADQTQTASLNAILVVTSSLTSSLDAAIQSGGLTSTTSLDSLIVALGALQTVSLDSLLERQNLTQQLALDSMLQTVGITGVSSLDAILTDSAPLLPAIDLPFGADMVSGRSSGFASNVHGSELEP